MSFAVAHPVRRSAWPVCGTRWMTRVATFHSHFARSPMQSTDDGFLPDWLLPSFFGRTSPEFSAPRTTPSVASLLALPVKTMRSSRQGKSGQTQVLCLVPKGQLLGAPSMPNISVWHNAASVCSLSQVIEMGSIPPRFFLSSRACAGILRRAAERGKQLPPQLHHALTQVSEGFKERLDKTQTTGMDI